MKKSIIVLFASALLFSTYSFMGITKKGSVCEFKATPPRSGGPAAILGTDYTGGPISSGTCTNCHGGVSANTMISVIVEDGNNLPISEYIAGDNYTIKYTVTNASFTKFGMQSVLLSSSNSQAGSMGSPISMNTQVSMLSGKQYVEHLGAASGTNTYTFITPWTAPSSGTGTVSIYSVGMAVNGNGNTGGDEVSSPITTQLTEFVPTSISYASPFCDNDGMQTPTIQGNLTGVFSSTMGLTINNTSGIIDVMNSTAGNYTVTYVAGAETVMTNITINQTYTTTDAISICANDTYNFGTQTLDATNSGLNTEVFQSNSGCDSTVTLTLTVLPNEFNTNASICGNDTYVFGTQTLDASNVGLNTEIFPNAMSNGCDSIVNLTLMINSNVFTETITICEYDTYVFGTQTLDASHVGLNTGVFPNAMVNGCDSIVNLTLNVTTIDDGITVSANNFLATQNGATYQWLDCTNFYQSINGSTNQSFDPGVADFSYAVEITLNGCIDTTDCLTQLSVNESSSKQTISIYPNPTNGILTIKGLSSLQSIRELSILNINGKIIQEIAFDNNKIDLRNLSYGVYFISIKHDLGVEFIRFVRN